MSRNFFLFFPSQKDQQQQQQVCKSAPETCSKWRTFASLKNVQKSRSRVVCGFICFSLSGKSKKKKSLAKSPVIWFRSSVHIERWSETQQLGECEQTASSPYFGGVSHFGTFHGVEGFFGVHVFRPMFVLFSRVLAFRRGTGIFDTTNETVITVREDILKVLFVFWIFVLGLFCPEDYFYFLFLFFWVKAMQKIYYFQEIIENR